MADEKTFTESEHIAILSDRVATETAALSDAKKSLESEKADLQNKLDVAEAAKAAAEQEKEKAEQELADFKTAQAKAEEKAARKTERIAKVKEAAAHLGAEFLDEANEKGAARIERIVAMEDDAFAGYVADLQDTAPAGGTTKTAEKPRETAMAGASSTASGDGTQPSAARSFLLARYSQKGD